MADPEIDVVVVTSPNTTHFSHAKLALESNKHVIVEKPFTNLKQRSGALVDDYFHIILGYGTLRVILQSGWVVKKSGPHFQVHGSKGSLIKYGLDTQEGDLKRGIRPGHPSWGKDKEEWYAKLTLGRELDVDARITTIPGCYESYYKGIYESVVNGAPLPVLSTEARDTIKIIEYAMQSQREQRVIVFS